MADKRYSIYAPPTKADYKRWDMLYGTAGGRRPGGGGLLSQSMSDGSYLDATPPIPVPTTYEEWLKSPHARGERIKITDKRRTVDRYLAENPNYTVRKWYTKDGGLSGAIGGAFDQFGKMAGDLIDEPGVQALLLAGAGGAAMGAYGGATTAGSGLTAAEGAGIAEGMTAAAAAPAAETAAFPWLSNAPAGSVFAAETAAPLGGAAMTAGGPAAAATGGGLWGALKAGAPTWGQIAAGGIPALIGAYAADRQADSYEGLARDYMALGGPSRDRYEASFDPNFKLTDMPGFTESMNVTTDTLLRRLSAGSGNPWGDPGGLAEVNRYVVGNVALPALDNYRRLNAGAGGLAALTSAAPSASAAAIDANANIWNAFGTGAANIFSPPKPAAQTLAELLLEMGKR